METCVYLYHLHIVSVYASTKICLRRQIWQWNAKLCLHSPFPFRAPTHLTDSAHVDLLSSRCGNHNICAGWKTAILHVTQMKWLCTGCKKGPNLGFFYPLFVVSLMFTLTRQSWQRYESRIIDFIMPILIRRCLMTLNIYSWSKLNS